MQSGEPGIEHADDDEGAAVEIDLASDRRRVAREEPGPRLVADHHSVAGLVTRAQRTAEEHRRRQHLEVVAGHQFRRERMSLRRHVARALRDRAGEEVAPIADRLVVPPSQVAAERVPRVPRDLVEAARVAHREGTQHVGVEDGEHAGSERQANRQREHRRGGEGRRAQQRAAPVAKILRELLEPHPRRLRRRRRNVPARRPGLQDSDPGHTLVCADVALWDTSVSARMRQIDNNS